MNNNTAKLIKIGKAAYGANWQSQTARAIGVDPRRIQQWVREDRIVPDSVLSDLIEVLVYRQQQINLALSETTPNFYFKSDDSWIENGKSVKDMSKIFEFMDVKVVATFESGQSKAGFVITSAQLDAENSEYGKVVIGCDCELSAFLTWIAKNHGQCKVDVRVFSGIPVSFDE